MTTVAESSNLGMPEHIQGAVLTPDSPGFTEEVAGFNLAHQPTPIVAVVAESDQDVAEAVRWATTSGLRVTVQATGHGLTGDLAGTVLISTRLLDGVVIDAQHRTARVGAGTRWRAVIDAAAEFGLAPLNGSSSGVGVIGYTLGGGLGPLARRYGFAADHVRSFTIVTADGEIRFVDPDREPDLFWAVLGGKIGFGIVTEMEFDLVPVARYFGGGVFYPGAHAAAVLDAWRSWAPQLPVDAATSVALLRMPPDPQLPPPLQGQFVVHLRYTDLGTPEAGAQRLAAMRSVAPVLIDTVAEMPYPAIDSVHMDPPLPLPCLARGMSLTAMPSAAVDAIVAAAGAESGSSLTMVEFRLLGGAVAAPAANSVAGREAAIAMHTIGVLAGPFADAVPGDLERVLGALQPWRARGLLNFAGHAGHDELRNLWSDTDIERLRTIAARFDPAGTFGAPGIFG
ncbi:FAD-binding oxidoreductase [Aldersonia sp. NBC_00410]|uniref:FAD-binding oxidoreductase n=1 Tax=Aldersonia sp. NBC_00410 TaxID=2975954 RepID=UPI00225802A0|nr:FAD-binding oxidoreductase [Aldersonia sp. NBC_00410]MCX5044420.1 FAD-binding oxidoreductase [Aldersonia sp. NBC_00410]